MAATRDYYADLELPPTADIQEIKRKFRKLALKYHPDRNPGQEQEVNSKFQIIQSAHEILTNPQEKAKYDATIGRSSRASGVKGNPWQNVSQQFPTPPRRNTAARNATSGAQRWQSRFSNGVPPTAKQQAAPDPEARKNAARAFENMRKSQSQGSSAQRETRPSQPPPPPPPRTESARQRAQASFGARKTGFHPRAGTPGDEPPVASQSYYSRRGTEHPQPPNPPPRPPQPTTMPDPLSRFRDYADSRQSTPYSSHGGEKTDPFDGIPLPRAKSTKEPNRRDGPSVSDEGLPKEQKHRSYSVPRSASKQEAASSVDHHQADEGKPHMADERADDYNDASFRSRAKSESSSGAAHDPATNAGQDSNTEKQPMTDAPTGSGSSIFNFSVADDAFEQASASPEPSRFAKSSIDDINTRFVNEDGSSPWQFSAGNGEQGDHPTGRPPSGGRANRRSPLKRPTMRKSKSTEQPETSSSGFNAHGWSDKFGPETFVPQPTPGTSVSPTRASRPNSKKVRTKPAVGNAAVVDDGSSDEETYEWRGRNNQTRPAAADSPQAMDIDSPSSDAAVPDAQPSSSARNIPVEPSRPEWRSGNVDSVTGDAKPERPAKIPINGNAAGSEDSQEFLASFADLKNVAPLSQQKVGLRSFTDLKDNLPFESKASEDLPIKLPKAHPLVFPTPPEAPRLPPTVIIEGIKPNAASWVKYLADFESYLQKWDDFNGQVVDHFATRKAHITRTRSSKGYAFLGARGDGEVQEYYNWVQQDNDVRQRWNAACEEHEKRFREYMAFREKMK